MAIRLTPGQLRELLGITKETLRYWKRDLSDLAISAGHSPCFGPGDLLATAVVKYVNDNAGVPVKRLAPLAPDLFRKCRDHAWPELERYTVLLLIESGRVEFVGQEGLPSPREVAIFVPLEPLVWELRKELLQIDGFEQRNLALPPVQIPSRAAR